MSRVGARAVRDRLIRLAAMLWVLAAGQVHAQLDSTVTQRYSGAFSRSISDKLQDTVSILDFPGCDRTGRTDSTGCIQAALHSGAKSVYVPAGRYRQSGLVLPQLTGFTLYGDGPNSVLIQTGGSIRYPEIIRALKLRLARNDPGPELRWHGGPCRHARHFVLANAGLAQPVVSQCADQSCLGATGRQSTDGDVYARRTDQEHPCLFGDCRSGRHRARAACIGFDDRRLSNGRRVRGQICPTGRAGSANHDVAEFASIQCRDQCDSSRRHREFLVSWKCHR